MSTVAWRYRGREITAEDTTFIEQLIGENRTWSRRRLSAELCRSWNWVHELKTWMQQQMALVRHPKEVIAHPEHWLPWNFSATPAATLALRIDTG